MKKHFLLTLLIALAISAVVVLAVVYWQVIKENKSFNWQSFSFVSKNQTPQVEITHEFTFDCPTGWKFEKTNAYDGKIKIKTCTVNYDNVNDGSWDDGVMISFKYIPKELSYSLEKEYGERIVGLSGYSDSKKYENNNFIGRVSGYEGYGLSLLARIKTDYGNYEVDAISMIQKIGIDKQDERLEIIDQIISSFKVIK